MIGLTLILIYAAIFQPASTGLAGALIHWRGH
jgi:hypothetical protein